MRPGDEGTAFAAALRRNEIEGAGKCDDPAAMAGFLDSCAQLLLGAVSPRLIWEGAQHVGLTALEMGHLTEVDPETARDLMWVETDRPAAAELVAQVHAKLEAGRARFRARKRQGE
jgi:hypothetical protein